MNDNHQDIPPLNRAQQLLFQKLLVHKVLKEGELSSLWSNLIKTTLDDRDSPSDNLHETLSIINKSIKPAFGLEIRSVSLALVIPTDENDESDDDDDDDENDGKESTTIPNEMYYTIVNIHPDEHSKKYSCVYFSKNPHELALFHLIVQRLIDAVSEHDPIKTRKFGLGSSLSRMEVINLRTELSGDHEGKVSLGQAESMMYWLEEQGWLVPALREDNKRNDSHGRKRRSSTSGHGSRLQLGPRSYLEFPDFLVKAGMEHDGLPQFILY